MHARWLLGHARDRPVRSGITLDLLPPFAKRGWQRGWRVLACVDASRVDVLLVDAMHRHGRPGAVEAGQKLRHAALARGSGGLAKVVAPGQHERLPIESVLALQERAPDASRPVLPDEDQAASDRHEFLVVGGDLRWHAVQDGHVLSPLEEVHHLRLRRLVDDENDLLDLRRDQLFAEPADRWLHNVGISHADWEEPGAGAFRRRPHAWARTSDGDHSQAHGLLRRDRECERLHA
mmetsp:Transcript_63110/g.162510  ORF Transcript_63110/g.162510 Transcript_63110/m.162510 type:complete len:235 (+) Transcript_63110:390-1094(+)